VRRDEPEHDAKPGSGEIAEGDCADRRYESGGSVGVKLLDRLPRPHTATVVDHGRFASAARREIATLLTRDPRVPTTLGVEGGPVGRFRLPVSTVAP
jgi:hypothetical protein